MLILVRLWSSKLSHVNYYFHILEEGLQEESLILANVLVHFHGKKINIGNWKIWNFNVGCEEPRETQEFIMGISPKISQIFSYTVTYHPA